MMSPRTSWLKAKQRKTYRFTDYFGKEVEITAKTRCVKAIHTRDSLNKNGNGKRIYYRGNDSKNYVATDNGYLLSFAETSNPVKIGSPDKSTSYVNVWGSNSKNHDTPEKLHRVVWYSFAMDAIENGGQMPAFLIEDDTGTITMSTVTGRLSKEDIKKLMKEAPSSHNGCEPPEKVPYEYIVHHFNEDRTDNSIENLILMPWWLHHKYKGSLHEMQNDIKDGKIPRLRDKYKDSLHEVQSGLQKDSKILSETHYAVVHDPNGDVNILKVCKWKNKE